MKKINWILLSFITLTIAACSFSDRGELVGTQGRKAWFHPQPYGTVYIPTGSIHMGANEQDVPMAMLAPNKQVSISAFYMDETEITNNEYRQFVDDVMDSVVRTKLGEVAPEKYMQNDEEGNPVGLNWRSKIDQDDIKANKDAFTDMYYSQEETYYRTKQYDVRKIIYKYEYIDLKSAAQFHKKDGYAKNRKDFKHDEEVKIYPDTLVFIRDFTYSYNEPLATVYFWHPKYDDYPVVGVNWHQARAFSAWRTTHLNSFYADNEENIVTAFRLPTEYEWNMLLVADAIRIYTLGEIIMFVMQKDVRLQTTSQDAESMILMEDIIQSEFLPIFQTILGCMICLETLQNGLAQHTKQIVTCLHTITILSFRLT